MEKDLKKIGFVKEYEDSDKIIYTDSKSVFIDAMSETSYDFIEYNKLKEKWFFVLSENYYGRYDIEIKSIQKVIDIKNILDG